MIASARLAPLYLELSLHAVELAFPGVATSGHAFRERCRQHLGLKEVGETPNRLTQRALVPQRDAVCDVKAGFPAHGVDVMRKLARETLRFQLRRCVGDEGGDRAGVTADRVARGPLVAHEHFGRRKGEALDHRVAVARGEAAIRQRLANARQSLAELRPERLELRLHGLAHEALRIVAHLEGLHVELVSDDRSELALAVEGSAVAVVRIEDRDELR